ncbi:hypothetical protein A2154_00660 [Candidatus Gottesmanbacteria bacterium RBG_16_43_7]|uniref:Major facilitator superfamily (MFS) profile domain-containing protein n=1 Tax=Candidatus Gottesmanbacteria bacterium RBG_16_43_7 TaxID=1798373 RepID=A0A1F5Z8A6_9BACT|nr:MAG: hypothetical protein A2154_00660 [Candidatus Gottesmanbacteria bacterium RBG_16_43_7]
MRRNIKLLALFNFFCDFRLYSAVMVIYFARVTDSYTLAMSLFAVTMVTSAMLEIPTGIFSDRIERKTTLVLGALASVIAHVFYAIGLSYWILFIGAAFEGLSRAFYSGNNDALLHDSLKSLNKQANFDEYLGKTQAFFQAALAIAAVTGSVIANWSFSLVMWLSVIPQALDLIISTQITEPQVFERKSGNIYLHIKSALSLFRTNFKIRLLSLYSIISQGLGEAAFEFRSAFIQMLWPLWAIGISKTMTFILGSISMWYSSKIIKLLKAERLLFINSAINRIINIIATSVPTVFSPLILTFSAFTYGPSQISEKKIFHNNFTDEQRATMDSLISLGGTLFYGLSAILIGLVADQIGPIKTYFYIQLVLIPMVFLAWKISKIK